jgi:isoquinoline 1-oxidoreductase beta subunit
VDVWSPTQDQSAAITLVADQLGVDPKIVYAHTMFLGGGFGGNGGGGTGVTRQAAEISRQIGKPVKVIWSREEDIAQDKQRPLAVAKLSAAIGDDGLPTALFTRAAWFTVDGINQVGGATADYGIYNMPYKIPHRQHERHNAKTHIPSSTHRAPGANQLGFMAEVFVDEMAIAGGWDPLEWRLKMTEGLADWQLVLKTLKEKSGFRTDLPKGEGMGVAVVESHGTIAAACATVTVSRRGRLDIEKLLVVLDAGQSACRHRAVRRLGLLGALTRLDGRPRAGKRPFRQHQLRHLQPAPHRPDSACRDDLRIVRRREMGWSRRTRRPAGASGRCQRNLLRDRQAHTLDAVPQP